MSYILEALRRADAQRDRGQVPDLHAQPELLAPLPPAESGGERQRSGRWLVAGLALGVCAAGAVAWWFSRDRTAPVQVAVDAPAVPVAAPAVAPRPGAGATPPKAATPSVAPSTPRAPIAAASMPVAAPIPKAAVRSPAPPPAVPTSPSAHPRPPAAQPRPEARPTASTMASKAPSPAVAGPAPAPAPTVPAASAPATARAAPATPATPAVGSTAAASGDTLPDWSTAPEAARRGLPTLVAGGSVYSPMPSARMLILNGHVFREGETIAGDLVLDQIGPRSAVLRVGDQRYRLAY